MNIPDWKCEQMLRTLYELYAAEHGIKITVTITRKEDGVA